jgi:hypothetical protein
MLNDAGRVTCKDANSKHFVENKKYRPVHDLLFRYQFNLRSGRLTEYFKVGYLPIIDLDYRHAKLVKIQ